jgi:hypothetical protein
MIEVYHFVSLIILNRMNRPLGKGDLDAVLVKGLFDFTR